MLLIENINDYGEDFYSKIILPNYLMKKNNNLSRLNDKKILKISYYLKNKLANDLNLCCYKIQYTIYKKPFLKTNDKIINFNISHHDDIVVLYYNNNENVGIDILNIDKDLHYYHSEYFTEEENNIINNKNIFYDIWLMKESYSKYIGKGLHNNLKNINFLSCLKSKIYKDIKFEFRNYKNYKICICQKNNT